MNNPAAEEKPFQLASRVLQEPEQYPQPVVQAAAFVVAEPDSPHAREVFMDIYRPASAIKGIVVGEGLPYPPTEQDYYRPWERGVPGIQLGWEPVNGWPLTLLTNDLARHFLVVGASGSGKSNLIKNVLVGLADLDA